MLNSQIELQEDYLSELIFNMCQVTEQLCQLITIHWIYNVYPSENGLSFLVIHATTRDLM